MTVKLAGLTHTGALILSVEGDICLVRCACGLEFRKHRVPLLKLRTKGFTLSCWRCKRQQLSELAKVRTQNLRGWP